MVGGPTHVKVEESSGDEEQAEQKRAKKAVAEGKGKGKAVALAGGSLDTNALVDRLTHAVPKFALFQTTIPDNFEGCVLLLLIFHQASRTCNMDSIRSIYP